MSVVTYADLAERLKISPEAARALAKRHRLPRSRANDGKTLVSVDLTEIEHKPLPARSPAVTGWTPSRSRRGSNRCKGSLPRSRRWRPVTGRTSSGSGIGPSNSWPSYSRRLRTHGGQGIDRPA